MINIVKMDFNDNRPNPDELLASIKFEEKKKKRVS